jgi:Domain of unknown function (DUF6531)
MDRLVPRLVFLALAAWAPTLFAQQQQQCTFQLWNSQEFGQVWIGPDPNIVGAEAAAPGINNHPGVTWDGTVSCVVNSGSVQLGTALDLCTANFSCGPPTCLTERPQAEQVLVQEFCQLFSTRSAVPPQSEVCSKNCPADPINPAIGNVFKTEDDGVFSGAAAPIAFRRFYNSADGTGADMGPGWRHSYDRSIVINNQATVTAVYPGASATVSPTYNSPATSTMCASCQPSRVRSVRCKSSRKIPRRSR